MTIRKIRSIKVAERILDKLLDDLADYEDELKIDGYVELFNNCREQGFVLIISDEDYKKNMHLWFCGQRNSDDPMVVWDYEEYLPSTAQWNMFSEESYYNRNEMFKDESKAAEFAFKIIKEYFESGQEWIGHEQLKED